MSAKFIVAVSLVIERNARVLLAHRSANKDHAPSTWEGISGRLEVNESPIHAAQREALEETGLSVEVVAPIDAFHFYRGADREEAIGIAFHCRVIGGELRLSEEHDKFAWVTQNQLQSYDLPAGLNKCICHVLEAK